MVKVILAFSSQQRGAQIESILTAAGIPVFRRCTSGGEVRRVMNQCGEGVLIAEYRLPDGTLDTLAWDFGKRTVVMLLDHAQQIELCENPDVFRLATPCTRGELCSAVNMLMQLYVMRLPRRSEAERQTVEHAKRLLMEKRGMTEPQAHRHLQKCAMNLEMKLADTAAKIISDFESNGGETP